MSRREFRQKMVRPAPALVVAPLALDALSAALAREVGFEAVYLGGGALGYTRGVTEALLTQSEVAEATRAICERVDINVVVDGTAGFGDPVHVARTIRLVEQAGAAAIEIEDQLAPKRVHHHKGIEHMVSKQEMVDKIKAAVDARRDGDFVIIARCNAISHDGIEDAIDRGGAYAEAGADLLMFAPRTPAEMKAVSQGTSLPLATLGYGFGEGGAAESLRAAGHALACDAASALVLQYRTLKTAYEGLRADKGYGVSRAENREIQAAIGRTMGIEALYDLEARTTERALYAQA